MSVLYHPGKSNIVTDALSTVFMGSVTHVVYDKKELVKEVQSLARLGTGLEEYPKGGFVVRHNFKSYLVVGVKSKQNLDPLLMELKVTVLSKSNESFSQWKDGVLRHQGRLYVPDVDGLREFIMEEAYGFHYSIHSGATKMYYDL